LKRWPVYVSGLLVITSCLLVYGVDVSFFRAISNLARDALMVGLAKPPQTENVAIVDIDDRSIEKLGQWPWSRHVLASMVDRLGQAGAAVVAFDVVFPEPDRTSPDLMIEQWRTYFQSPLQLSGHAEPLENFDRIMSGAISRTPTVLAVYGRFSDEPVEASSVTHDPLYRGRYIEKGLASRSWLPQASSVLAPIDTLYQSAASVGFINTAPDRDMIIRSTPLVFAYGPQRVYPSLSLESLRLALGRQQFLIQYDDQGVEGVKHVRVGDFFIPTDAHGRMVVNYRSESFPRYSVIDVLEGRVGQDELGGRIIFVGTSAAGLNDLVGTPIRPEFPGVEVHATALDNILAGDMLQEPRWAFVANVLFMVVTGFFLVVIIASARAMWSAMYTLLLVGAAAGVAVWLVHQHQLLLIPAEGVFTLLAVYTVVTLVKYRQEESEKKKIRSMFGTMVSSDVLNYLETNPESFSLVGRRMECTMFFSDIAGFTPISERLPPEQLSALLNDYMTPMTDIIMRHGGFVDKFNGDMIMAVWGAPFESKSQAEKACRTAIEQLKTLDKLNIELRRKYDVQIDIRIGINTGTVTAGNMGSSNRFQYTVLGDSVNVASRLEGLNKKYGTRVIISESTREKLPADIRTRPLDEVLVPGKSKPVKVHELLLDGAGDLTESLTHENI